jgi:beta-glucosidase
MTATTQPETRLSGRLEFPAGFRWGAATSAYQVEGAVAAAGRGVSIWDTFAHTPGAVDGGDTGDLACDHYQRYRDDVRLMADLGLSAYRFSVSWPRVQPTGTGPASPAGLDFYQRLVDELLGRGIEPWLTLYHWELPQPLEDAGGWPVRDTASRFAEFAAHVHAALGDRVNRWITINEPWCASFLGYASGVHAPGRREPASAVRAAHHLLLGHGLAARALRAADAAADAGIALDLVPITPASGAPGDVEAARRVDGVRNRLFLDPVLRGSYPRDVVADLAGTSDFSHVRDGDLAIVSEPGAFLAINYYQRHVAAAAAPDQPGIGSAWVGAEDLRFVTTGRPKTEMGWEIDASGLSEILLRIHKEYPPIPLYVTENGGAFPDEVGPDGQVNDPDRVGYLDAHLRACHQTIAGGAPLNGYFVWSLLDNFEWAAGFSKRFGIVYVDYATQQRTPKASARWYSRVIRQGALDSAPSPDAE